jgi:hypothetical protein
LAEDVDGNGAVEPLDVLLAINYLNTGTPGVSPIFADVTGDGLLTPQDVLRIINAINGAVAAQVLPESEPGPLAAANTAADPDSAAETVVRPWHPASGLLESSPAPAGSLRAQATPVALLAASSIRDVFRDFEDDLAATLDAIAADVQQAWAA